MKASNGTPQSTSPMISQPSRSPGWEQTTPRLPRHPALPRPRLVRRAAVLLLLVVGVTPVAFGQSWAAPDTYALASASAPATVRLLASTNLVGWHPWSLVELQTQPATEKLIGPIFSMINVGLDFAPDGRLYGYGDALRVIDPDTGSAQTLWTEISGIPTGGTIVAYDIAFHPNGTLYLVTTRKVGTDDWQNEFYTVDLTTGVAQEVCHMPALVQCIDFSPTGVLYGEFVDLCIIDLAVKTITPVSYVPHLTRMITGMDFASDGFIYGTDFLTRRVCRIDPSTGDIVQEYGPYVTDLLNIATPPPAPGTGPEVLVNASGLAGTTGSEKFYQVEVPAGRSKLEITTSGGTGDVDLYVKKGSKPTTSSYGWRSYRSGNNESVAIDNPQAGTYHLMLRGYAAYSGVTLNVTCYP
jgi:hypothetical protein